MKASIAGFRESALTRGADAYLDVGGHLFLDLGNRLLNLDNRERGSGAGR